MTRQIVVRASRLPVPIVVRASRLPVPIVVRASRLPVPIVARASRLLVHSGTILLAALCLAAPASAQFSPTVAPPAAVASAPTSAPQAAPPPERALGGDIVDLYETGVVNLEKICDDYRRIKAIQLAQEMDLPYEEAYRNISSVMPVLTDIDKGLLRQAIRDPSDITPHKREVERVERDVEMMIDLATKLLAEIEVAKLIIMEGGAGTPPPEATLEEIVQREEYDPEKVITIASVRGSTNRSLRELEEEAKQDDEERAKDLTAMMRPLLPDIKDLTQTEEGKDAPPPNLFTSTNNVQGLMGISAADANKSFGRKAAEGGQEAEWMFVTSWYTIGPFPNPQRINLNTKFPPETVVDLDAAYPGKGGRLVKWEWTQANQEQVMPAHPDEYAIYYAYTEVHCDRPMDLWVAVGSDDKANVWMNGLPIWVSSDQLKGWRLDEGFRKVSFRKGVNKFLYRVENGWLNVAFSLGIRVAK